MATYTSFEELDCYKKYRMVRSWVHSFLKEQGIKDRDIIQNIIRNGKYTTRNITGGFGRHRHKENMQYSRIARGFLHEVVDDFNIIEDKGLASKIHLEQGRKLDYQALISINGCIKVYQRPQ